MRRSVPTSLVAGALVVGCATLPAAERTPGVPEVVERPDGPDLAVLARPTAALRLSLWIDAGSRDADPPQVATLAGWLAAESAGPNVTAWVTPDGTELSMPCARASLAPCVQALARALAHRAPSAASVADARERLVRGRRLAVAADPGREAERLALEALLGERAAAHLFPLGSASDDAGATQERVTTFLDAHYGPRRALVVAAGDADLGALSAAVEPAFAPLPPARADRARRDVLPVGPGGVRTAIADEGHARVALAARDEAAALARAEMLVRALARPPARSRARAHAFPVRGGALALVRVTSAAKPEAVVAQTARALAAQEATPSRPADRARAAPDAGLLAISRHAGLHWCAGAEGASDPSAAAMGLLVAGPRGEGAPSADPDALQREATTRRLDALWQRTRAAGASMDTALGDARAAMHLDNGARVEIAWREGPHVAIALLFGGGAALDPTLVHGRTALVALLVARCVRDERFAAEPVVESDVWGVALSTAREEWQRGLARVVGCALDPSPTRDELVAVRLELHEAFAGRDAPAALRAATATLLAPHRPGLVAPWGSEHGSSHPPRDEVAAAWRAAAVGARASLAVVGDVPLQEATVESARWLAGLEAGSTAPAPALADAEAEPPAPAPPPEGDAPLLAVAAWRATDALGADPAGGLAFAVAMRALLARRPELEVVWHDGGASGTEGWAALAVRAAPAGIRALPTLLDTTAKMLDAPTLAHAVDTTARTLDRHRTDSAAGLGAEAARLARTALGGADAPHSIERARVLAAKLATAPPRWRVLP